MYTGIMDDEHMQKATFAGGCFWCTEAIFKRLEGVVSVKSGYAGGDVDNPSYYVVSSGKTNHAEAIQVTFDPHVIFYEKLLDIFWHMHNPTTKNQQGADVGTQYRSIIFYHDQKQKTRANKSKKDLEKSGEYKDPIVTEILPFSNFYIAEAYHQNYYEKNETAPYCSIVIGPKLKKLLEKYGNDIKQEYIDIT